MIRSAKEAREELVACYDGDGCLVESHHDARIYLAALEGPEVKALVEVITKASLEIGQSSREPDKMLCVKGWLDRTLAQHREAIK